MDKVGILVKLFLNVIRFLCENGKGAVKILQGIFRRLQQGLAVREAAELAGRGQNPGIDQVRKNGMEIVSKPALVVERSFFPASLFAQSIMAASSPENCARRSLYFPSFL